MEDEHLQRIGSNNPALTAPSSLAISLTRTTTGRRRNDKPSPSGEDNVEGVSVRFISHDKPPLSGVSKYDRGWRKVVRNFSPSWFSVTMGTGIVSLLFITIPWKTDWLYWLSVVFFVLNLILFAVASVISLLRYTLYPEIWTVMIHDPTAALFLGTIPMGAATLIESFIFLCCPYWGSWATTLAWVLWILDSVASLAVTVSLSFILISRAHLQSLDRITAAQLLPIAATIVASGTGAESAHTLLEYNHDPQRALGTLIASYVLWGMSTPFALVTLVIYYQRLAVHKLPPREIIVSSFLPLGPLGMGGYTIMYLGMQARAILPQVSPFLAHVETAGDFIYLMGIFTALIMWAWGLMWFVYALAAIYSCGSFPFNMGWWGFTFPLGVFAVSTIQLGIEFPSLFFRVLGTIFSIMVILLWVVVFAGTMRGAWRGDLFNAPCLKLLPVQAKHGACVNSTNGNIASPDQLAREEDIEKGL